MEWDITGDVSTGTVDNEELCYKYTLKVLCLLFMLNIKCIASQV